VTAADRCGNSGQRSPLRSSPLEPFFEHHHGVRIAVPLSNQFRAGLQASRSVYSAPIWLDWVNRNIVISAGGWRSVAALSR
jgi:hypothetical protein